MFDQPLPRRAHVITGGFPPGQPAGHDHDLARLTLLALLRDQGIGASTGNDFADVAKWLSVSKLLVTYVAGPYPNLEQTGAMRQWLESGGHWLGLHGTSGGRAERVEGVRQRRTVKTEHHALLGGMFLTHPPICDFQIDVVADHPVTTGLGPSFTVRDEPYFVEVQDPANTRILLTSVFDQADPWPVVDTLYGRDTSLCADGRSRVIAYTRAVGRGAVTYIALGHCHDGVRRDDGTPERYRGVWNEASFGLLLRNAILWGVG
jgi:type 1 glutamine amidotransferase